MTTIPYRTALIVGAGSGISASVARGLAPAGVNAGEKTHWLAGCPSEPLLMSNRRPNRGLSWQSLDNQSRPIRAHSEQATADRMCLAG
jgi:NAD(P)-dependent dehydrogenase (short-subunit alcohol dehydrogenase family)